MMKKLKSILASFKTELKTYQFVLQDKRTPKLAKWLLGIAIAYFLSPIDLIPDFIPILGQLDDLLLVPFLVIIALRIIPSDVVKDCRTRAIGSAN